jgi:hypothetical protein
VYVRVCVCVCVYAWVGACIREREREDRACRKLKTKVGFYRGHGLLSLFLSLFLSERAQLECVGGTFANIGAFAYNT